ncbi:hypothetical protein ABKN59_011636 [Abortiporus biennis]
MDSFPSTYSSYHTNSNGKSVSGRIHLNDAQLHNLSVPIARLPSELLLDIFQEYADLSRSDIFTPKNQWIRITHVCSFWRTIALDYPLLWNHILLTGNSECVNEMIKRSQKTPLIVSGATPGFYSVEDDEDFRLTEIIRPLIVMLPRIIEVDLTCIRYFRAEFEEELFKQGRHDEIQAPLLKSIIMEDSYEMIQPWHAQGYIPFAQYEKYPSLESIQVTSVNASMIRLLSLPSDTLRHLSLTEIFWDIAPILIPALERLTSLETLTLKRALPYNLSPSLRPPEELFRWPSTITTLHKLRQISIEGFASRCADFLSELQTNPQTKFSLEITETRIYSGFKVNLTRILAVISKTWGQKDPVRTIVLRPHSQQSVELLAWSNDQVDRNSCSHPQAEPKLRLILRYTLNHPLLPTLLALIFRELPTNSIQTLQIDNEELHHDFTFPNLVMIPATWVNILKELPDLRRLNLNSIPLMLGLLPALWWPTRSDSESMFVAKLETLSLSCINFRASDADLMVVLNQSLRWRKSRGSVLSRLHIKRCLNFNEVDSSSLSNKYGIAKVEWDGQGGLHPLGRRRSISL